MGKESDRTGFAGRSLENRLGGVRSTSFSRGLDMARPMVLGLQLVWLYRLGIGGSESGSSGLCICWVIHELVSLPPVPLPRPPDRLSNL